ncbi:MAG: putative membrane protein [Cellvibrionaceae bacterium]|jgi:uncharacterized membrane protein
MTKPNSRIVTFIATGVLIIGLFQFWQAAAISTRSLIATSYGINSTPIQVRTIFTIVWGCIWIWNAFQLYRHRQSSRTMLLFVSSIIMYTLFQLILALLSPSIIDQQRWVTLLIPAFFAIVGGVIYQKHTQTQTK